MKQAVRTHINQTVLLLAVIEILEIKKKVCMSPEQAEEGIKGDKCQADLSTLSELIP